MARTVRISSLKEAQLQATVGVPVIFKDGVGAISDAIPSTLGGIEIPRTLSKAWCSNQGLKEVAGQLGRAAFAPRIERRVRLVGLE